MEINSYKIHDIIIVLFMTRSRRYNIDCNGKNLLEKIEESLLSFRDGEVEFLDMLSYYDSNILQYV